jgi:hypothetical protein
MKEYRFLAEYANHIKRQIKAADMPQEQKKEYQKQTDLIVSRVHHGMITLSDGMMQLAKADAWLVRYNNSTHYGG